MPGFNAPASADISATPDVFGICMNARGLVPSNEGLGSDSSFAGTGTCGVITILPSVI
jgi:hypothetical protein